MSRRLRTGSSYLNWAHVAFADGEFVDAGSVREGWVMGLAVNYPADAIEPFVRSLRTFFAGRITLIVSPDPTVLALLASYDVDARVAEESRTWRPHFVVERFAVFAQLLRQAPPLTPVLLTDVRDVIFQAPPFGEPVEPIEGYPEGNGIRMSDHAFNVRYLEALVGSGIAGDLNDRSPLCVGTVVGQAASVAALCRIMLLICAIPRSGRGGAFGADQAAFNLVAHLGLLTVDIRANYGRVATLGWPDSGDAVADHTGVIVNPDGSVSPIVHQYDRRPDLVEAVARRWGVAAVIRATPRTLSSRWSKARASASKWLPEAR